MPIKSNFFGFIFMLVLFLPFHAFSQFGGFSPADFGAEEETLSDEELTQLSELKLYAFTYEFMDQYLNTQKSTVILSEISKGEEYRVWTTDFSVMTQSLAEVPVKKVEKYRAGGYKISLENLVFHFGFPPINPTKPGIINTAGELTDEFTVIELKTEPAELEKQLDRLRLDVKQLLSAAEFAEEVVLSFEEKLDAALKEQGRQKQRELLSEVFTQLKEESLFSEAHEQLEILLASTSGELKLDILQTFTDSLHDSGINRNSLTSEELNELTVLQNFIHRTAATIYSPEKNSSDNVTNGYAFRTLVSNIFIGYDPNAEISSIYDPSLKLLKSINKSILSDDIKQFLGNTTQANLLENEIEIPSLLRLGSNSAYICESLLK